MIAKRSYQIEHREPLVWENLDQRTEGVWLIIAGSRTLSTTHGRKIVWDTLESELSNPGFLIRGIVSGGAIGVDRIAEAYAKNYGFSVKRFLPDWDGIGRSAGYVRNERMAQFGDALLAIWDGASKGTAHMINCMRLAGKPLRVVELPQSQPRFVPGYQLRDLTCCPLKNARRYC